MVNPFEVKPFVDDDEEPIDLDDDEEPIGPIDDDEEPIDDLDLDDDKEPIDDTWVEDPEDPTIDEDFVSDLDFSDKELPDPVFIPDDEPKCKGDPECDNKAPGSKCDLDTGFCIILPEKTPRYLMVDGHRDRCRTHVQCQRHFQDPNMICENLSGVCTWPPTQFLVASPICRSNTDCSSGY